MNSDTTKAFCAGVLIPTIAFYVWNASSSHKSRRSAALSHDENEGDDEDDDDGEDGEDGEDEEDDDDKNDANISAMADWDLRHAPYKLLLIVNTELSMGKGKMCAQCGHATLGVYQRAMRRCPLGIAAWERTGCAKIAVKCPTLIELEALAVQAQQRNVPYYLVEDAGRTQIAAGSRTVLGIFGPVSMFDGWTDHLKLM